MSDAYSYSQPIGNEDETSFHVGISDDGAVKALRELADRIERKEINLEKVRVFTFADGDEFTKTALKLIFAEKR